MDEVFLPMEKGSEPDRAHLEEASTLDPRNPKILYYRACDSMDRADALVRERALDAARGILGVEIETVDPKGFKQIVDTMSAGLRTQMIEERRPSLLQARDFLIRAVDAGPTVARYHALLAEVLVELDPAAPEIQRETDVALWLAPKGPATLFAVGRVLLLQTLDATFAQDKETTFAMIRDCFRGAIYAEPSYADLVYPMVQRVMGGRTALLAVTPRSLRAYESLCRSLWDSGDWEGVLACLDTIDELAQSRDANGVKQLPSRSNVVVDDDWRMDSPEGLTRGAFGYDSRSFSAISRSVAQRRCTVLGILGRWRQREEVVIQYRSLLRTQLDQHITEARRLRKNGRPEEAMILYLRVLRRDWANPQARLDVAEISSLPHVLDDLPEWNAPLDHLYRLVINSTELSREDHDRAMKILSELPLREPPNQLVADFVRGAAAVLAGKTRDGVAALKMLAERHHRGEKVVTVWRQRHLIWYYLGLGYEELRDRDKTIQAYRRVVDIVPTHRPALLRLNELDTSDANNARTQLGMLKPGVPCNVNFGGKIVLLGYTLAREEISSDGKDAAEDGDVWTMTYYWQFHDRMFRDYHPAVHFCDENWRTIFQNDHYIRKNGKPYPVDFPRCGEVVVQKFDLSEDPTDVRYMRLPIWSPNPPRLGPSHLYHKGGEDALRFSISHKVP